MFYDFLLLVSFYDILLQLLRKRSLGFMALY